MQTENTLQTNNPTTETPQSTKKKFSLKQKWWKVNRSDYQFKICDIQR